MSVGLVQNEPGTEPVLGEQRELWVLWGHPGALGRFGATSQPHVPVQRWCSVTLLWTALMVPSTAVPGEEQD